MGIPTEELKNFDLLRIIMYYTNFSDQLPVCAQDIGQNGITVGVNRTSVVSRDPNKECSITLGSDRIFFKF